MPLTFLAVSLFVLVVAIAIFKARTGDPLHRVLDDEADALEVDAFKSLGLAQVDQQTQLRGRLLQMHSRGRS